jgi:hypothetical protein
MKKKLKNKYFFILFIFFTIIIQSQDINNKWVVGIGAGGVLYSEADGPSIGYRYSEQFPRLSIARYMFKNVTFAGAISTHIDVNRKYTTFDGEARYDFGTSENRLSPYVLVGGSFIDQKYLLPVINFGIGGTLWISDRFGLNGQLMYKVNHLGFQSQGSHIYGSGNLVYRFDFGSGTSRKRGNRRRLWERKH